MDAYSRKARLAPAILAAIPAVALLGSGAIDPKKAASVVAMTVGAIGIVVCGIVRDLGRGLQPRLWASWGGSPTLQRLRLRDAANRRSVERLHRRLQPLLAEPLPSDSDEQRDPADADRRYDEAVAVLRERTRNRKRFPLVFAENVEYGFRRNCFGLRPIAIGVAIAVLVISIVFLVVAHGAFSGRAARYGVSAVIAIVACIAWWKLVTPGWVRRAAELYADRLIESIEGLRQVDT